MTPADFVAAYRPTADQVSAGTGIDPIALLAQWWNETGGGTSWAGAPFNLGNIESSGKVVAFPSLAAFAQACVATFQNGYYNGVLAASNAVDQLAAIVASPWAAGHYGGSLMSEYALLEGFELTPDEHSQLAECAQILTNLGSYPVGQAALSAGHILENLGSYPVGAAALAAGAAAPKIDTLIQAVADLKASISTSGTALSPAQAAQLTHIESMLTTGLKGT